MTAFRKTSGAAITAGGALRQENQDAYARVASSAAPRIALLTAGRDKSYALGLASALISQGEVVDFVGSDLVDAPELHGNPRLNYLNLRNQRVDAGLLQKMTRVVAYYLRLVRYAFTAQPPIFHILWNNKFELFDRTLLMAYYKWLGKKIVFTAHNVNAGVRDANDSFLNRLTLRFQYALSNHIFVHTQGMKDELASGFALRPEKITVIPFGVNNTVPNTALTRAEARREMGIGIGHKTLLFFGRLVSYKGIEYLIEAFSKLAAQQPDLHLIIAGSTDDDRSYWERIQQIISRADGRERIIQKIQFIPDEETELFFKAADALVLPYVHIYQSGVLFLGYSFGLPVLGADVGSLREEIIEGRTGFVFPAKDSVALAKCIETYFCSDLYKDLESRRQEIKEYANERYSWSKVAVITANLYAQLCRESR
jgi:D-inositol-3-phosphate glycosyltransferase